MASAEQHGVAFHRRATVRRVQHQSLDVFPQANPAVNVRFDVVVQGVDVTGESRGVRQVSQGADVLRAGKVDWLENAVRITEGRSSKSRRFQP